MEGIHELLRDLFNGYTTESYDTSFMVVEDRITFDLPPRYRQLVRSLAILNCESEAAATVGVLKRLLDAWEKDRDLLA